MWAQPRILMPSRSAAQLARTAPEDQGPDEPSAPIIVAPPATAATPLFAFGLFVALWPVLIVHACWALSVAQGFVELCNPYWDGCTSISRAGRSGWAFFLFKAGMLPFAVLQAVFWWINLCWLQAAGAARARAMLVCGWIGVAFLIVYAVFLGIDGPVYELMRRFGIDFYFAGTFFAQILLLLRLRSLAPGGRSPVGPMVAGGNPPSSSSLGAAERETSSIVNRGAPPPGWLVAALAAFVVVVLSLGLFFYAAHLGLIEADRNRLENTMEWSAALLMQAAILMTVLGWRSERLEVVVLRGGSRRPSS